MASPSPLSKYLQADDNEQYEMMRERWAKLNWNLVSKAEEAVDSIEKGGNTQKIGSIVLAAGVGFDKLYARRTESVKPLAFPAPLAEMVLKGLVGANGPVGKVVSVDSAPSATDDLLPVHHPLQTPLGRSESNRRNYQKLDKQARLDKATALRHARKAARLQMIEDAKLQIAQAIPWQNTIPIDKGIV
jgi:hypothetical protein